MNRRDNKVFPQWATPGRMAVSVGLLAIAIVAASKYLASSTTREAAIETPARADHVPPPEVPDAPAEAGRDLVMEARANALAADRDWEGLLDLLREGHAKAVCPALLKGIGSYDEEVRFYSNCLMIWVGNVARPQIPDILGSLDFTESLRSAFQTVIALESIGPPLVEDIPAIEKLMVGPALGRKISKRRPTCHWRVECAHALARLGHKAAHTVPSFALLLEHSDLYANRMATRALVDMGPSGASGIPMILEHKSRRMTGGVYDVYDGVATFGERAAPYLIDALRQADSDVCTVALFQICRIGKPAEKTVPALLDLYKTPGRQFKNRILDALVATETNDPEVLRQIEKEMLSGEPEYNRYSAMRAFVALAREDETPRILRLLIPLLDDKKQKWFAIRELGKIGPAAHEAVPALKEFMLHDYMQLVLAAALSYWQITGDMPGALVAIGRFFDKPKWPSDYFAFRILETMGPAARGAVGRIDEVIAKEQISMVYRAAMARYRITGDPGPTIKALIKIVDTYPSGQYGQKAEIALGSFGPRAKAAVPTLVKALAFRNMLHEGVYCIRAIRSILGPDSFPADVLQHAVLPSSNKPWKVLRKPAAERPPDEAFPPEEWPPEGVDVF